MLFERCVLVLTIVALIPKSFCVVMSESSSKREASGVYQSDTEQHFSDSFFQCYKESRDSAFPCIDQSARAGLSSFFSKENLEFSEGLSLIEEEPLKENLDDPLFRDQHHKTIVDAASAYLAARSIRWDMSTLYPGLVMRIGPTLTAGAGILEFAMEPTRHYTDRALGPGRLVMRQTIVPLLLGVKVSVAALVPLLLFGVVILVKKALFLSQLSTVLSAVLGFGSVAAAAAAGAGGFGGGGGGIYPSAHGHAAHSHIVDGFPLRHRLPHQITQLANGPLIVDIPPPWSHNREVLRADSPSSTGEKILLEDASANPAQHQSSGITRTERKTKNPRGFLWEQDKTKNNGYNNRDPDQTNSNIFPRES